MVSDDNLARTRPSRPPATPLSDLARWLGDHASGSRSAGDLGVPVTGVSLSSQRVLPGDVYAALPGSRLHGIRFAAAAVDAGTVGLG